MSHKQPQTEPVHVKEQESNVPGKDAPPEVDNPPASLIDNAIPVHQTKPVPPGSLKPGQDGTVTLRYTVQEDGASARIYGTLDGTGGGAVDFGVLPGLIVS